jgi:hypothetical protein
MEYGCKNRNRGYPHLPVWEDVIEPYFACWRVFRQVPDELQYAAAKDGLPEDKRMRPRIVSLFCELADRFDGAGRLREPPAQLEAGALAQA